jgi:hypothetical protein
MSEQIDNAQRTDRPIGELVRDLSEQTTALVRQEVELAKAELGVKARNAGIGVGMFGGAGALGFYALGALTATLILGLATVVDAWLAALIVTVAYGAIAGVLALRGKTKVQQATPPVPERAVASAKEDVRYTKEKVQEARR